MRGEVWRRLLPALGAVLLVAFLVAPILAIVPVSFSRSTLLVYPPDGFSLRWYRELAGDPRWLRGLVTTLLLGSGSAACATVIGFCTAYWMELSRSRSRALVLPLLLLTVVLPAPVLALAFYVAFRGYAAAPSWLTLLLAYTLLGTGYTFVAARLAFGRFPVRLEETALSFGASALRVFFSIRLKASARFLLAGFTLALVVSMDDVVFAFFLADQRVRPLNILLWEGLRTSLSPVIAAVAVVLSLLMTVAFHFVRRSEESSRA